MFVFSPMCRNEWENEDCRNWGKSSKNGILVRKRNPSMVANPLQVEGTKVNKYRPIHVSHPATATLAQNMEAARRRLPWNWDHIDHRAFGEGYP